MKRGPCWQRGQGKGNTEATVETHDHPQVSLGTRSFFTGEAGVSLLASFPKKYL